MIKFFSTKNFYLTILLISIITIISAIYVEYIIGAKPCKLCLYQRFPYILSIFLSFFAYIFQNKRFWIYLIIFNFLISFFLSIYHVGIENNIFPEFSGCTVENLSVVDKELLLETLNDITPNCKDVTFTIIGLSLATINAIISLLIIVISITILKYEKNK
tara:strand:- start:1097 stop:1576 length:480 start_codon:yes stop_codon:yes gene_type:complete